MKHGTIEETLSTAAHEPFAVGVEESISNISRKISGLDYLLGAPNNGDAASPPHSCMVKEVCTQSGGYNVACGLTAKPWRAIIAR